MPRQSSRKRKQCDSVELNVLKKKIIKLEKALCNRKTRRKRIVSSTSESDSSDVETLRSRSRSPTPLRSASPPPAPSTTQDGQPLMSSEEETGPSSRGAGVVNNVAAPPPPSPPLEPLPGPSGSNADVLTATCPDNVMELTDDILEILGEDPSVIKTYGKDIQKDIAIRFQHIATNGLSKELRKELKEKYLVPANCPLIDAPEINPEMRAAISDAVAKRLKGMELKQKQIASAISCIGEAVTLLLSKKDKDPSLLKLLMDSGRILCDSQYSESLTRRGFVLASLKKEMRDQLLLTKIDSSLFGKDLSETLKSAKAVNKSGAELKTTNTPAKRPPITKTASSKNNLNWRAPSNRRSTRTQRTQGPATRTQHASTSKTSRHSSRHRRQ